MGKKKEMEYYIDCFKKYENNILIKGWGISLISGKALTVKIVLKNDSVIGPFSATLNRADISSRFIDKISEEFYGYNIKIENDILYIKGFIFEDIDSNISKFVNVNKIKRIDSLFNKIIRKLVRLASGKIDTDDKSESTYTDSILYRVDEFKKVENSIYIRGWGISFLSGNPLTLSILLKNRKILGPFEANAKRADVNSIYCKKIKTAICGFDLNLDINIKSIKGIFFEDKENNYKKFVDIGKIRNPYGLFRKIISKNAGIFAAIKRAFQIIFIQKKLPKSFKDLKRYIKGFYRVVYQRSGYDYHMWIRDNEPSQLKINKQRLHVFENNPKISIITPTYNTPPVFFNELMESLIAQTYRNWELCIADGGSNPETKETLKKWQEQEPRVKLVFLKDNLGIAGNTNSAADLASGEYIALLDHDDTLASFALFEVVTAINLTKSVDFIYSDEDKINEKNNFRSEPYFKPDFAIDTFRSNNYICHFTVIKKSLFDKIGGFRSGFDGSQDYDIFLRATEVAEKIVHISKILYHWRVHSNSVASQSGAKPYTMVAAQKALKEHLARLNIKGIVKDGLFPNSYKIEYEITGAPKISIIIPNKDHIQDLKVCINSIIDKSSYKNYEIIIVENNSDESETFAYYKTLEKYSNVKVITWTGEFNYSAINNYGVKYASGEVLLLLNNDVEVINDDWLERMLEYAIREDVGAVGAKLYYPDDSIQHAGIIIGLGGIAGHSHKSLKKE